MCKVLMSRDLEIEVNHQIYSVFNLIFNQDIQAGFFPNLIWYQEFLRLGLGKPWLVAVSTWREKRNFLTLCMHYLSHSLMLFAFLIFHIVLILVPVLLHILCNNGIFLHSGLNPAWHFWLSTRFSSNVGSVCIVMVWRDSEAISVSLSKQVADKFGDWWYGKKQLHTCRELSTYWCPLWFDEKNRDWNSLCNNKKVTKLIRFFLWIVHDTKEKYWYKTFIHTGFLQPFFKAVFIQKKNSVWVSIPFLYALCTISYNIANCPKADWPAWPWKLKFGNKYWPYIVWSRLASWVVSDSFYNGITLVLNWYNLINPGSGCSAN